jgi:small ligand-binding sensory domain FIST
MSVDTVRFVAAAKSFENSSPGTVIFMPYAASLSQLGPTADAVESVCAEVLKQLNGVTPDLSFVFVSHHHRAAFHELAELIQQRLKSKVLLGCAAETVAGGELEIENEPAMSLWSAVLPETNLLPFHLEFERTPDGIVSSGWPTEFKDLQDDIRAVFLLGDPFSTAIDPIIERLNTDLPGIPLIGGMASGGRGPGENALFLNGNHVGFGGVGVMVQGGPQIESVVSQGCRPIGHNFIVTKAEDNLVQDLGGKPAMERLQEIFVDLPERDQELVQQGPHLGIVMNEYQETFEMGDFLISNVVGVDKESGAVAIGNRVRVGQTVRFHVRDAQTAHEELHALLTRSVENSDAAPRAALLFSCNGRGTRLFPGANHDAGSIQKRLNTVPLTGFFAQGELGPVGKTNYIHGYTASIAVFRD